MSHRERIQYRIRYTDADGVSQIADCFATDPRLSKPDEKLCGELRDYFNRLGCQLVTLEVFERMGFMAYEQETYTGPRLVAGFDVDQAA